MLYIVISYGVPNMTHGVFDTLYKADKALNDLRFNKYKNIYDRQFSIQKIELNQIYKSGADYV